MFESLDEDKENRTFSPINILGINRIDESYNSFKNVLNSYMDHCWDNAYQCQFRLARFPGLLVLDQKYELYFTGTQPANTRYTIEAADEDDYLIVKIDYSQSIVYKVFVSTNRGAEVDFPAQRYNRTLNKPGPLNISNCGDSRYEQSLYIYEFVQRKNCTVYLRAQNHLIGLARLQIPVSELFEDNFVSKLSYALGITTDQIRIVGISSGSTVVEYQIISAKSAEIDQRKNLVEMSQLLTAKYAEGTLDLGASILDIISQVITASGTSVTSGTGDYKKKEIHPSVYALLFFSSVAVLGGIIYGTIKVMKMSKMYKEVMNEDSVDGKKVIKEVRDGFELKSETPQLEEVKDHS